MNVTSLVLVGLTTALLINLFAANGGAGAQQSQLADQVLLIFEQKCAKCHGPKEMRTNTNPNADFNTIMDLPSVVANREILVPGDLNESKLWAMVDDDLMPDAEQDEEPLPDGEKQIIRQWILAGSPVN